MGARTHVNNTQLAPGTANTTATFQGTGNPAATISNTDLVAASVWALFYMGEVNNATNTTTEARSRLQNTTVPTTYNSQDTEENSTSSWFPFSGVYPAAFSAGAASQSLALEKANESGVASINMRDAQLTAVRLEGNDTSVSVTGQTTTGAAFANVSGAAITAAADGVYDIHVTVTDSTTAVTTTGAYRLLLEDGSTTTPQFTPEAWKDATDFATKHLFVRRCLRAGETITLQARRWAGSGTVTMERVDMVMLDLSRFDHYPLQQDGNSRTGGTGTTYAQLNANRDLAFGPHGVDPYLFFCVEDHSFPSGTSTVIGMRWVVDGTEIFESVVSSAVGTYKTSILGLSYAAAPSLASKSLALETKGNGTTACSSEFGYVGAYRLNDGSGTSTRRKRLFRGGDRSGNTTVTDTTVPLTQGDAVVVGVMWQNGGGTPGTMSISDSAGNSWTKQVEENDGNSSHKTGATIFTCIAAANAKSTITVTNSNGGDIFIAMDGWRYPAAQHNGFGGKGSAAGAVGSGNTLTVTLDAAPATEDETIAFYAARESTAMTFTAGTGFTNIWDGREGTSTDVHHWGVQYRESSTSSSVDVTIASGADQREVMAALVVKGIATATTVIALPGGQQRLVGRR